MSKRTVFRFAAPLLLLIVAALIAGIAFLRVYAVPPCDGADRSWRATDPSELNPSGWSSIIRRAKLDYIVATMDGAHRLLVFQRAYRPNDSDVDLVFMPSGVADVLIVYRLTGTSEAGIAKCACSPRPNKSLRRTSGRSNV
jgi:hypothetical protein